MFPSQGGVNTQTCRVLRYDSDLAPHPPTPPWCRTVTDAGLLAKKLTRIETCIKDLELVAPASIEGNIVHERFVEHTLQIAIQAALDIASHIVADERLGDADTNHALFDLIARHGWIAVDRVPVMHRMVGFRNVLVHEYKDVDVRLVRVIVERHVSDLQAFVDSIRAKLGEP